MTLERIDLVFLLNSFYQKDRKENVDPYESGSSRTMYCGIVRHLTDEFSSAENRDDVKHLGAVLTAFLNQSFKSTDFAISSFLLFLM